MFKRIATAAVGSLLALQVTSAEARPYFGYDGRHYGEVKASPDYGRSQEAQKQRHAKHTGGGSRRGLTPAALALLDRIESKFGPVNVISGYRPGARIAGSGRVSRHASGNAIDFEAGRRKGAIVRWLIANHHSGGTMTYADMSHIHADIGPHFVSLGSGSGHGSAHRSQRRRSASRYASESSRGDRYERRGERYGNGYGRRGYERRGARYGDGYGRRGPTHHGAQFASGYAALYR